MKQFDTIRESIFEYVKKSSLNDLSKLNGTTQLFKEGIFDSMAFVLLIDYIEESFGILPGDDDLVEENFETIDAITSYIIRKKEVMAL